MTSTASLLRGRVWNGTRWVCKWCHGKGCLACPNGEPVLNAPMPSPAPPDEPPELIDHVFEDNGRGLCKVLIGDESNKVRCGRRTEVHHLLQQISYEELADHSSPAFQIFKATAGRDAMVKAFGPGGGGMDELRANGEHAKRRLVASEAVFSTCPKCGAEQMDLDGFGVLKCEHCDFCNHASVNGGVCGLCGATIE